MYGSAEAAWPGEEPAQLPRFGDYRLLNIMTSGGGSELILAALEGPDNFSKLCLIKRLQMSGAEDDGRLAAFTREAKLAALMNHPNIAHVFDFGRLGDHCYVAIEHIDGASLEMLMRRAQALDCPLGPRPAVLIGRAVCEALGYLADLAQQGAPRGPLFGQGLSPSCIWVSRAGGVKLTDVGISRPLGANEDDPSARTISRLSYLSPERVRSQPVDVQSSIFSLGVVLFEVATGRRLFRRSTPGETLAAVSEARVPRPSELVLGFPESLEHILQRALARDPSDRYQSPEEMARDLEAVRIEEQWAAGSSILAGLVQSLAQKRFGQTGSAIIAPSSPADPDEPLEQVQGPQPRLALIEDELEPTPPPAGRGSLSIAVSVVVGALSTGVLWWLLLGAR